MTHDELLELVDKYMAFSEGFGPTACLALRAVVELHKPVQSYLFDEEACSHCSSEEIGRASCRERV